MNITLNGTKITQDSKTLAFEKNNNVDEIVITVDTDESWSYKLDVKYPDKFNIGKDALYNIIDLGRNGDICSVTLTREMLPFNGKYTMQLRGINGDKVYHSDTFEVWVKYSIEPGSTYNPVPSEFYQVEARLDNVVKSALDTLSEEIANIPSGGSGLTTAEKTAMLALFKAAAYTSDVSATITKLDTLWSGSGESGGGSGGESGGGESETTYTVTNNLTNVTNSNSDTTASGFYSATLTVVDGYSMNSVVITMGGVDITDSVYGDGGILITEVTGDIVITAVAGVALAYALPEPLTFPGTGNAVYDTGYAMYPNGAKDVSVCIDFDHTNSPWSEIVLATANVNYGYKLYHTGNRKWRVNSNAGDAVTEMTLPLTNCRIVYVQGKNKDFAIYVLVDDIVTKIAPNAYSYYPAASENTVILGTNNTSFVGAINDFRVYDQILSDGQIEAYLRGGSI